MSAIAAKQIMKHCTGLISLNPPFNSASPRNSTQLVAQTPGPGTYNLPPRDYQKTEKYHTKLEKKDELQSSFEWMFSDTRSKSLRCRDNNKYIGPGSYEVSRINRCLHNGWGRSSRFSIKNQNLSLPGPGSYQSNAFESFSKYRNSFGSIFKSKSPKTSKILFENVQLSKSKAYHLKAFFDESEEHQQYQNFKKEQATSPFFSSKVPRFRTQSYSSEIGPGSYEISPSEKSSLKHDRPCLIRASNNLKSLDKQQLKKERINSEVGPGSYNMAKYEMSRILQYKGLPLPRQTRFNFSGKKKNESQLLPGPGHYMFKKYKYLNQQTRSSKIRQHKLKEGIGRHINSTLRSIKMQTEVREGPGSYDVNQFDIRVKAEKKRQFAQKLKLMDIQLPAFSSKVPRLK